MRLRGGTDAARRYLYYGDESWEGYRPREPAPASTYDVALAQVNGIASLLRAGVVAAMGNAPWLAARQPWVDIFARSDHASSRAVGRFRVYDSAAPGEAFTVERCGLASVGYGSPDTAQMQQIPIDTPGAYRLHVHGPARSESGSPGTTIALAVVDGATQRATMTGTRQSSNVAEHIMLGQEGYLFLPTEGDLLTIASGPIMLRNASASTVGLDGVLLYLWR